MSLVQTPTAHSSFLYSFSEPRVPGSLTLGNLTVFSQSTLGLISLRSHYLGPKFWMLIDSLPREVIEGDEGSIVPSTSPK